MIIRKAARIGLIFAIGMVLVFYFQPMKSLSLVAKGTVLVYASESDAMATPAPPAISQISAEQSVSVLRCVDVKHYLIYQVLLPDGRTGFVNAGEYVLMESGKQAVC